MAFLSMLSMVQASVAWVGLASGLVVCVWGVAEGSLTVGDTVLFVTMMQQLYVPLTYFGSYYRQVSHAQWQVAAPVCLEEHGMCQHAAVRWGCSLMYFAPSCCFCCPCCCCCTTKHVLHLLPPLLLLLPQVGKALIDMENMFELLATPPAIQDVPGARPLTLANGSVEFQDVVFGYSASAPVLKGVSFTAAGGSTVAVVGSTGSGKSTILRLLLRLYDPQGGRVLIDGQDISRVTQGSVRRAIAVVPQDTVLFNDTILYNIRYGRPSASDSQVGAGWVGG
jgi:ABC-type transport system involved in Fe-S cluster assembly fused permease/ATPase subunit